ncbi:hypothetical protein MPSEU_000096900 [Mayamaea pseudoterrestris]|nr:hypothetical protein MPSEU_000096900 [Mayamaea pseudoterrestris]
MKVETPQVRWHADEKGKNQALFGVSLLPAGGSFSILATAGNNFGIHLWKVHFAKADNGENSSNFNNKTTFEFLTSLTRHESSINALSFSPDGLHLASASDSGAIIVWSVPVHLRGNNNGRYYWSQVVKECDLKVNIVPRGGQGISDLSWSGDSKRFVLGTIDSVVVVCENVYHRDATQESAFKCVHLNSTDHSHFVQGVAYDPQGVYLASMSSDRTVRIHTRKSPVKKTMKKKVLRTVANSTAAPAGTGTVSNNIPPPAHQRFVESFLTDSKLEMGTKTKLIKFRRVNSSLHHQTGTMETDAVIGMSVPKPARQHLFADESTLQSFVRRLAWTTDGAYLITPSVMWQTTLDSQPQFATALWGRHNWDEPARILLGMEKPSIAVRPNPVLFELPHSIPQSQDEYAAKENQSMKASNGLPYRSIFAVLTWDSVLVYDTLHAQPLAVARGLHYAHMTDATWSPDGHHLVICSSDGYISVVSFAAGELGQVYVPRTEEAVASPPTAGELSATTGSTASGVADHVQNGAVTTDRFNTSNECASSPLASTLVPPCEPGNAKVFEGPPAKKQKVRIAPTCVRAFGGVITTDRPPDGDVVMADDVGQAVNQMSLEEPATNVEARPKKRIQPTLVSMG